MPELPEVETTLRGLEPHIINKKIEQIIVRQSQLRWKVPVFKLEQNLVGNIFTSIKRSAKYLILNLDKGSLIIHLGMSGTLRLVYKKTETEKVEEILDPLQYYVKVSYMITYILSRDCVGHVNVII